MSPDPQSEPRSGEIPLLRVENIHKQFGYKQVLKGVSLSLSSGNATLLMGRNGAGKSTLVRILSGLMRPTRGELFFKDNPLSDVASEYRKSFGLISHQNLFYDDLTAKENLTFFAKLEGISKPSTKIKQALARTGLEKATDLQVKAFSSGMGKRLNIARIMISDPDILFLDEPYSGLDLDSIQLLNSYLSEFKQKGGAVLLISHQLDSCYHVCESVAMLNNGKIKRWVETANTSSEKLIQIFQNEV